MRVGFVRRSEAKLKGCRSGFGVENGVVLTEANPKRSQFAAQIGGDRQPTPAPPVEGSRRYTGGRLGWIPLDSGIQPYKKQ
jgi:hypothetical protein